MPHPFRILFKLDLSNQRKRQPRKLARARAEQNLNSSSNSGLRSGLSCPIRRVKNESTQNMNNQPRRNLRQTYRRRKLLIRMCPSRAPPLISKETRTESKSTSIVWIRYTEGNYFCIMLFVYTTRSLNVPSPVNTPSNTSSLGSQLRLCCISVVNARQSLDPASDLSNTLVTTNRFRCSWPRCGKEFTVASRLTTHYRIHSGKPPYLCGMWSLVMAAPLHLLKGHLLIYSPSHFHTLHCRLQGL